MILDDLWFRLNTFNTEKGMNAWSPLDANTEATMSISSSLALGRSLLDTKLGSFFLKTNKRTY